MTKKVRRAEYRSDAAAAYGLPVDTRFIMLSFARAFIVTSFCFICGVSVAEVIRLAVTKPVLVQVRSIIRSFSLVSQSALFSLCLDT